MNTTFMEKTRLGAVVSVVALGILVVATAMADLAVVFHQSMALGMLMVLMLSCAAGLFLSTGKKYYDCWLIGCEP